MLAFSERFIEQQDKVIEGTRETHSKVRFARRAWKALGGFECRSLDLLTSERATDAQAIRQPRSATKVRGARSDCCGCLTCCISSAHAMGRLRLKCPPQNQSLGRFAAAYPSRPEPCFGQPQGHAFVHPPPTRTYRISMQVTRERPWASTKRAWASSFFSLTPGRRKLFAYVCRLVWTSRSSSPTGPPCRLRKDHPVSYPPPADR